MDGGWSALNTKYVNGQCPRAVREIRLFKLVMAVSVCLVIFEGQKKHLEVLDVLLLEQLRHAGWHH